MDRNLTSSPLSDYNDLADKRETRSMSMSKGTRTKEKSNIRIQSKLKPQTNTVNSELLPAANLSSPSKKSELKTPPHSTLRTSSRSCDDTSNSLHSLQRDGKSNGLLSPEFSSPSLYERPLEVQQQHHHHHHRHQYQYQNQPQLQQPQAPNSIFKPANININIIHDSPNTDTFEDPLRSPNFNRKRRRQSITENHHTQQQLKKKSSNKPVCTEQHESDFVLPNPEDMPEITFTGNTKPPYSYASLIGMALLRAPDRRLTLAEIYQWISDHFKFYKKGEVGWQNSIRHNLSLNKAFQKTEKLKEKKGHFWQIVPGFEHIFCNIKETKRNGGGASSSSSSSSSSLSSSSASLSTSQNLKNSKRNNPQTPKSQSFTTDTDRDDDKDNEIDLFHSDMVSTPLSKSTMSHESYALNARYIHNRNASDGLSSIPEVNISATPTHLFSDISPGPISIANTSVEFATSFSSRANFEFSPIKPIENGPIGPILEPVTPKLNQNCPLPSIASQLKSLQHIPPSNSKNANTSRIRSTPFHQLNTPDNSFSNSSRKYWASPSYLDDFYTSPVNKPLLSNTSHMQNIPSITTNVFGSPIVGKSLSFSTNEIFGIDICHISNDDE